MGLLSRIGSTVTLLATVSSFVQILVYLPLVLEIAGRPGYMFLSMTLSFYFFLQGTFNLAVRNTRWAKAKRIVNLMQIIAVPSILLLCLNLYSASSKGVTVQQHPTLLQTLPVYWEKSLRISSPLFAVLEAVSTVLVVQAAGQISAHFVEDRSENWQFVFLISSATTYVLCAWNLFRAYKFAAREPWNATLIGASITSVIFLSAISFGLRRGSSVEASLILAYVVLNIYYLSSEGPDFTEFFRTKSHDMVVPPLLMQSKTAILTFLRTMFGQGVDFIGAAAAALPLPVLVGMTYRIIALYFGGTVLLAFKRGRKDYSPKIRLSQEDPLERTFSLILGYSRCILICVYTHLLLLDESGRNVYWKWTATLLVLGLWAVEIVLQGPEEESSRAVVKGLRLKRD